MIQSIALIGAGNLATQLGKALKKSGFKIDMVYSRTEKSARELARLLECPFTTSLKEVNPSDLVIVSVKDDALESVLHQLNIGDSIVVHTAGSVPMDLLSNYFKEYGVFYPLQTFSKKRDIGFSEIPICLEASSETVFQELNKVALKLSRTVQNVNSEKRKILHLAAVFTCNFVNHLYQIGDQLLEKENFDFSLLKPLIKETAEKVMSLKPIDAQTGPAIRFDETIINKHLKLLTDEQELKKIYSFVSESIHKTHLKN